MKMINFKHLMIWVGRGSKSTLVDHYISGDYSESLKRIEICYQNTDSVDVKKIIANQLTVLGRLISLSSLEVAHLLTDFDKDGIEVLIGEDSLSILLSLFFTNECENTYSKEFSKKYIIKELAKLGLLTDDIEHQINTAWY